MSYGDRPSDALLQFQGFVPQDVSGAAATASVEVSLPSLSGGGGGEDPLWPIRLNVLRSLLIAPEHNAQAYMRSPALRARLQAMQRRPDARAATERLLWALPFTFALAGDGSPSVDLLTFLRVGALRGKAEAAAALKAADAARRGAQEAIEAHRAGAAARAAQADSEEEDDFEMQLLLPVLAPENEARAQAALADLLTRTVHLIEAAAAPAQLTEQGAEGERAPLPVDSPVRPYREVQLRTLRLALERARRGVEEVQANLGGDALK